MALRNDIALGALALCLCHQQAAAQDAPVPPETPESPEDETPETDTPEPDTVPVDDDEEAIVITAQGLRGSVPGDIVPEVSLDARDIRATGATSIGELLETLEPQIGSVRGRGGGRPVFLIEGRRISGFRELRDLPPEAIERVDILPEEAALQYGYPAEQRVVNFVLRERFNSTGVELEARGATDGGRAGYEIELDRLYLGGGKRTSLSFETEYVSRLTEDERDIVLQPVPTLDGAIDPRSQRTLLPATRQTELAASHRRQLGELGLTVSLGLEQNDSESLLGPSLLTLDIPEDSPFFEQFGNQVVRDAGLGALGRQARSRTAELNAALISGPGTWRWSVTGDLAYGDQRSIRDSGGDPTQFQSRLDRLDPAFDPSAPYLIDAFEPRDRSLRETRQARIDGLLNGPLFETGAGEATVSFRAEAGTFALDSENLRDGETTTIDLSRDRFFGAANVDVPLTDRDFAIGRLSLSANASIESLSDFGELYRYGGALSWRPTGNLNLLASYSREEGAPSLTQLGDPRLANPESRFFDFTTGETALVTAITGGNPDLLADSRDVLKVQANWEVPAPNDLNFRIEYVTSRIDDPVNSFPGLTEEIEAAFPSRFERDADGRLLRVDLTPVNYDEERRDTLRTGFTWSKRLRTKPPSPETIARFRTMFAARRSEGQGEQRPATAPAAQQEEASQGQTQQGQSSQGQSSQGQSPQGQPPQGQPQQGEANNAEAQPGQQGQPAQAQGQPRAQNRQRGGGGGGFGGGRGGRLYASVYHTWTLTDDARIAPGLDRLDYLDGQPVGRFGGRSEHRVEADGGIFNNGYGARVSVNWQSGTSVDTLTGPIRFDDYGTVDLRIYANLSENLSLLSKAPWVRGTSVRLFVDNLFNERPYADGRGGIIPFNYQSDLLAPEGRTVGISIRRLFIPTRFLREEFARGRRGG